MNSIFRTLTLFAGAAVLAGQAFATDEVLYWNDAHLQAIKTAGGAGAPPPKASRNLAIQSIAVYDAVNAIDRTHTAYHYNGIADAGTSRQAAIAQASYLTMKALYPTQNFDSQLAARLSLIADGTAKSQGISLGTTVANDIMTLRSNDGSANNVVYTGGTAPGQWRPTGPGFANGLLPLWGKVTPFGMTTGSQFREGPPPALTSQAYTDAYNEVKSVGSATSATRTADQTEIAKFWADGGGTVTPPGHWNRIAQTVANTLGKSEAENARMFALLNMATADAGISCWDMKYEYSFWRPVTAINLGDTDGNGDTAVDASWTPLITTPPFPGFSSGHSTFSAAAAEVLKDFAGGDNFAFSTTTDFSGINARSFNSFSQAVQEAGMSRIYGGIHFQFDNVIGQKCGAQVGNYMVNNYLRAVPEPGSIVTLALGGLMLIRRRRSN